MTAPPRTCRRRLHPEPDVVNQTMRRLMEQPADAQRAAEYMRLLTFWAEATMVDRSSSPGGQAGARKLGATTPAGARLENTSQFLLHLIDDLVRSVQHWHKVYSSNPRKISAADD
ncbi:hypothetical protein [Streptomyces cucumeris]|uniref:hypothetical protein n=1 Tax=Streptomyces cucumeris TaxID=2962890 RepID=UPI003EBE9FD0